MASDLILDGTKIAWYKDRVDAWHRGERIAPITIDMSLLPRAKCNFDCKFCYAVLQYNEHTRNITEDIIKSFLNDAAEIGVKGISFVSDGESSHSPAFVPAIQHGDSVGLAMAVGSNSLTITREVSEQILPHLTYLRVNISAGEPKRFAEIMGAKEHWFERVCQNIRDMVDIKARDGLKCTIGMQMVLMPDMADQILPLSNLAVDLGADYLIIKHCSDDEFGHIGVDYEGYESLYDLLEEAESLSNDHTRIAVKWSKIGDKGKRSYQRCYGPPFMLQISGTGLIAPCGMLFNDRYKKLYHIGNICDTSFREIWESDRYWEVMRRLSSMAFNAQKMCGSLCLQHKVNEALDGHVNHGRPIEHPGTDLPEHGEFV